MSMHLAPCPMCPYNSGRCDSDNLSIICPIITKWVLHSVERNQGFRIVGSDFDQLREIVSPPPPPRPQRTNIEQQEIGLNCMQNERASQFKEYGKFVSSAQSPTPKKWGRPTR